MSSQQLAKPKQPIHDEIDIEKDIVGISKADYTVIRDSAYSAHERWFLVMSLFWRYLES